MTALALPRFRRLRKNRFFITLAIVAFVLLLPVFIPVAFVAHFLEQRKMRAVVLASKCPACGAPLDLEALTRGEARWQEIMREIAAKRRPNMRWRVVRDVHALCCSCGVELTYRETTRDLIVCAKKPPALLSCLGQEVKRLRSHQARCGSA